MPANGRPEAEVIVNFTDGLSYNKKRLEEAFSSGVFDTPAKKKEITKSADVKADAVDIIVHELEIPKQQAEKALAAHKGDLIAALKSLITP